MKHHTPCHLVAALAAALTLLFGPPSAPAAVQVSEVKLARPTPQQYAWHEQERIQFVCLDPCTWEGREYDNHSTPLAAPNTFNVNRAAQVTAETRSALKVELTAEDGSDFAGTVWIRPRPNE